jgi:deoxyribose-phosphate aldolase
MRVMLGGRRSVLRSASFSSYSSQSVVIPARTLDERREIAAVIDHTLLRPEATTGDIERLCEEALIHCFASVCVNPCWVSLVARRLEGSPVRVCTVVGFPLGASVAQCKMQECEVARNHGAEEIDMVLNIGGLRSGDYHLVFKEIADVATVARGGGGLLKVIIETCLLGDEQKRTACRLAKDAGADFVKTSTGFSTGGATIEDVRLMRSVVGPALGVKASGGIRSLASLRSMLEAGANRIGASAGINILQELGGDRHREPAGSY